MLTDKLIKNTKPSDKIFRLSDGRGLYLEVAPAGGKWWRFRYRFLGKEKSLSLGVYPDVSLKDARERLDEVRKTLSKGSDPSEVRKFEKTSMIKCKQDTFESIAKEWLSKHDCTPDHKKRTFRRLELDIFPWLGSRPVSEISASDILLCLRRIEERGALETAHRISQNCGQVFRYAISTARATRNPIPDLRGAIPPAQKEHLPAITDPKEIGPLLRAIDGYEGTFIVKCALKLAPLVFVRPGELRKAKWVDIDFEKCEWRYFITKTKVDHIVPLSSQAISILKEIQPLTGSSVYVFPSIRDFNRPMSDNAILSAFRRMGISTEEMCGHGFRAMARTVLDEVLEFRSDLIEHQLAHSVKDPNGRAYNRTAHLPQRKHMMQVWSTYLDKLKTEGVVIPMNKSAV
ncbi:MAG: tyrosine-type recombinase/integrase [Pseudobdellovibrionaceae bacterium]